jgi:hypothetical protein
VLAALLFAKLFYRLNLLTIGDFYKVRYGKSVEVLTSVAIDRFGKVSHCVRLDPDGLAVIGDMNRATLEEIVNGIESQPWHNHPRRRHLPRLV